MPLSTIKKGVYQSESIQQLLFCTRRMIWCPVLWTWILDVNNLKTYKFFITCDNISWCIYAWPEVNTFKSKRISKRKLCLKNAKSPMHFCPKARCIVFEGTVASYFFFYCYMKLDDFLILFPHFWLFKKKWRGNCFQKNIFLYVFISKQSVFVSCCFEYYPHVSLTRSSHLGFPSFSVLLVYTVIFVKTFYIKEWLHFKCTCTYIIRSFGSLHKALNV